ncbi:ABC transporter permease subunit [Pediococcus ethanolidurans]|uniref:carbohydrate ABC transporter permease n=1 Tax=Pediococcus ethanolidurans TaxID=319653 RepID=UPI002954BA8D|nr:sugar ABC transporter permease [Pediococcus ethanolidurans]MDV7719170.1 ABC transporter permease subunit [Pediococcus ethanolidurans]
MKSRKKGKKIPLTYYLMVVPIGILFFIFHTVPFLRGVFYSFTNWTGYGTWKFVGLKNYMYMFGNGNITDAYWFTFKFALFATVLVNAIALAIAVGLNGKIKFQNFLKAIYFLPYMLGTLIVGFVFKFIFGNLLPEFGHLVHLSFLYNNILGTTHAWIGILIVTIWQGLAFNTLIYLAGLQSVDPEIYEAASLDGVGPWQKFRNITFPLIAPFFTINLVLSVKGYLMVFDQIMAMTNGGPGNSTTSISVEIYTQGFQGSQFAIQSANAVVLFIVVLVISLIQLRILNKREERLS